MLEKMTSQRQRGLSLVELMIALALGLLLLGAVLQLFQGSRATYTTAEALARVQENGRFALTLIKPDLREIGVAGFCAGEVPVRNHLRTDCPGFVNEIFDASQGLFGYNFVGTGRFQAYTTPTNLNPAGIARNQWIARTPNGGTLNLPEPLQNRVVPGTDVFILRRPEIVPGVTAAGNTPSNASSINLTGPHGLAPNEIVLITNCATHADLFQNIQGGGGGGGTQATALASGSASCTNPGPGNRNLNWSTSYGPGMQLFRVRTNAYFIGFNADRGEPGLYRANLSTSTNTPVIEELVEGVESMQVLFGMSNPANLGGDGQSVDLWLGAHEVSDWGLVIAVRISLLVRSPAPAGGERIVQTFDLLTTDVTTPQDGRLRQPFSTTITLRNRQLVL